MTYEKFNEARDLDEAMSYLLELEATISNAGNEKRVLAAIEPIEYEDARKIVIKQCKVNRHVKLSSEMKEAFLKIIREKHNELYQKFLAL